MKLEDYITNTPTKPPTYKEMDNFLRPQCAICKKSLTDFELKNTHRYACQHTCTEHTVYSQIVMIDVVRKRLGYITEYPGWMLNCGICGVELTQEELDGIQPDDMRACCKKHTDTRHWQQSDLAKYWFEFKEIKPNADKFSAFDMHEFRFWLLNKKITTPALEPGTNNMENQENEPLSYGQKAVGLTSNPRNNKQVDDLKYRFASLIDAMDALRNNITTPPEQKRLASIAITEAQSAQMWAVKAVTWKE